MHKNISPDNDDEFNSSSLLLAFFFAWTIISAKKFNWVKLVHLKLIKGKRKDALCYTHTYSSHSSFFCRGGWYGDVMGWVHLFHAYSFIFFFKYLWKIYNMHAKVQYHYFLKFLLQNLLKLEKKQKNNHGN